MKHQENMSMQWNSVTRHANRQGDNNKVLIESCLEAGDKLASIFGVNTLKLAKLMLNIQF